MLRKDVYYVDTSTLIPFLKNKESFYFYELKNPKRIYL